MASSGERLVENQRTFRSANERISDLVRVQDGKRVPYLCECADIACFGRLEASVSEFVLIHEDRAHYFILPGHMRVDGEEILSANARYEVVDKRAA
ncbi:MAG: hypothetical protein ACRDNI_11570 [Gaiellaceae bacterium]